MSENDNHPQEWTPTMAVVRSAYFTAMGYTGRRAEALKLNGEFDRFLAEVRAEAWDAAKLAAIGRVQALIPTGDLCRELSRQINALSLSPSTPNPETTVPVPDEENHK